MPQIGTDPIADQFRAAAKAEPDPQTSYRMLAMALLIEGYFFEEITAVLGVCEQSVKNWIEWYNEGGLEGLRPAPRPGPPPRLDEQQHQTLAAAVTSDARDYGFVQPAWTIQMVREYIRRAFNVELCESAAYEALHRAGLRLVTPRSVNPRADRVKKKSSAGT